jgi:hypothetical protein
VERLLRAEALEVALEARPACEPVPPGQLDLGVRELRRPAGGAALAGKLLGLLPKLLKVERCVYGELLSRGPSSACTGHRYTMRSG